MRRWLVAGVLVLAGCLDDVEDPRPGPPGEEPDGGRFNPDLIKPGGGGGYGSGAGTGSGAGSNPRPSGEAGPADGGAADGVVSDAGRDAGVDAGG